MRQLLQHQDCFIKIISQIEGNQKPAMPRNCPWKRLSNCIKYEKVTFTLRLLFATTFKATEREESSQKEEEAKLTSLLNSSEKKTRKKTSID